MSDQNIFSQQPQFTAAPQPDYGAPAQTSEPEVILQESPFADFGFDENDSVGQGHNFGGFMEDDNKPDAMVDEFNAFNSQTPNFDLADVEAAAKAASFEEKAMFTSTTVNFDLAAVEAASKNKTAEDIDIFSSSVAVGEREQTTSDAPSFDAATAIFTEPEKVAEPVLPDTPPAFEVAPSEPKVDFMSSMASMFNALNNTAAPAPSAPVVEAAPVEIPQAAPAVEVAPVEIPQEVPAEEAIPAIFSEPDTVVNIPAAPVIQDISSTADEPSKNDDYWNNINKMLNNFDETQAPATDDTAPASPVMAAPAMPAAPAFDAKPEIVEEPVEEKEAQSRFPFSESAPDANVVSVAQVPSTTVNNDVSNNSSDIVIASPIDEPSGDADYDEKMLKTQERIKRQEERAAKKAAKLEAKANKKSDKDSQKKSKGIVKSIFPNKEDSVLVIIRKIVSIISVIAVLACGIYFLVTFIGSQSHKNDSKKLSEMMITGESMTDEWSKIYEKYPNIQFPYGMQIKFSELYAMNQDLVGWISIDGLEIDYPVVQTTDDSFYLKHDFEKKYSDYGTIFLSSGNTVSDELDLNTVLYGHAMRLDRQMFSALRDYKDKEVFINNPIIEYNTLYDNYKFKVYCVFITNGSSDSDNGYLLDYTFANLSTAESFAGFVGEINERRLYSTGVDILPTDKIICLSTCTYEFSNARFVVVGRLVRDGESLEIDTSKVEDNENPRYPQAWYDANGETNPYANYSHWTPS